MRGKAPFGSYFVSCYRITPAYAGKRSRGKSRYYRVWDHPRLCGEKPPNQKKMLLQIGSPPPMRGKGRKKGKGQGKNRITPAYAGKSCNAAAHGFCKGDHPRLCGEKGSMSDLSAHPKGSPPPMRGKGRYHFDFDTTTGITPAYAGKSSSWSTTPSWKKDHPRLCGEKHLTL